MLVWVLNTSLNSFSCNSLNNSWYSRMKKLNTIYKDLVSLVARKLEFHQRNCVFLEIAVFFWNIFWGKSWSKISRWQCSLWGNYCNRSSFPLLFFANRWVIKNQVFLFLNKFYHGFLTRWISWIKTWIG